MFKIKSKSLYWWISPYGLAIISLIPLCFSLLMPRGLYEYYANESCLMCDSLWMPFFCLLCSAAFALGAFVCSFLNKSSLKRRSNSKRSEVRKHFLLIISGLSGLFLLNLASFLIILRNTPGLVSLIISGGGDVAKQAINTEGSFSQVQPLLIYFNAYALNRYFRLKGSLNGSEKKSFLALIFICFFLTSLIAIAKVARYEMIPIVCSLLFVVLEYKARTTVISRAKIILYLLFIFFGLASIFSFFSFLRGYTEISDVIQTFIGYGPASYNHLVALLDGELVPTYGGSGVYAFPFLGHIPVLESAFRISDLLGLPTGENVFLAEFSDAGSAGLNRMYIWITMYGYLFSDLGYLVFPFMFLYGYTSKILFDDQRDGGVLGAFFYPLIFVSMLLSFSFNVLLRPAVLAILVVALMMALLERVMLKSNKGYLVKA